MAITKQNAKKKYLIITADYNDGDYVSDKNEVSDEDLIEFQPIIEVLKKQQKLTSHNWETRECSDNCTPEILYIETGKLTEEQVELFDFYVPKGEYGSHTITSIELLEVVKETKLLSRW